MSVATAADHAAAHALIAAREESRLLPLLTAADASFTLDRAYAVADEIRRLRIAAGETPRGYKIGFTNRGIWQRYGVHAPIWGPIWNSTLEFASSVNEAVVPLAPFVQPRLEPEIVFSFAQAPAAGMDETELAACIDWVAHGLEIVHTHFEGWRFLAPDTVADFALHGRLVVGARVPAAAFGADLGVTLSKLRVTLACDGRDIETGCAGIVLGGPLTALRLWVDAMAAQPQRWPIERGDIVTTGTITDAAPMHRGERWHTRIDDDRFQGLVLHTTA